MLKYAPLSVKEKLQQNNMNTINKLQKSKSNKYKQTLKFMTEWSNDLLERQHDVQESQQLLNQQLLNLQAKTKTSRSHKTQSTSATKCNQMGQLDIQKIIEEQLIKKIQNVYTKQILLYETNHAANQTFNTDQSSSHLQSVQSHPNKSQDSYQNNERIPENFQNYFKGYECQSNSKNCSESQNQQGFSKASELIQQQYNSNSIDDQDGEDSFDQIDPRGHTTYEQNFSSF